MKARCLLLCAVFAMFFASTAGADHPNIARGFDIGRPYQMNGIDNVNLFNGNLTVTIPIGQRYHVNGNLGYGLTLTFSGNVWDYVIQGCDTGATALGAPVPSRRSNAGIGWFLSLGRLFQGNHAPILETPPDTWYYETPDGALHDFELGLHGVASSDPTLQYTRDGSYIRLKLNANDRTVELPDGTLQIFQEMQPPDNCAQGNCAWTLATAHTFIWRLTSIKDRFGNTVSISYSSAAANGTTTPAYPEIWTIADGPRTQKVYFVAAASPYSVKLDRISLSTFVGPAEWSFAYSQQTLTPYYGRTCVSHDPFSVPLLTSVTLPPGANGVHQVYSMIDPDPNAPPGTPYYVLNADNNLTGRANGQLKGIHLPTGGWLEWDYNLYKYYDTEERYSRSIVVSKRRMKDAGRSLVGEWTYYRQNSSGRTCIDSENQSYQARPEQLVVAVITPEGNSTVHYFSTEDHELDPGQCNASSSTFQDPDYALPFSRATSKTVDGVTWYLSSEVFASSIASALALATGPSTSYRITGTNLLRSEWVAYIVDPDSQPVGGAAFNPRETAHATYFEDDQGCGSMTCFAGVRRFHFDGAGHFRQSSTSGNFPAAGNNAGNYKTTFTSYPDLDPVGVWLLNRYTEQCTVDETQARVVEAHACSDLTGANVVFQSFVTKACFDATTGFLERTRTLSLANPSTTDVVAEYIDDGHGNVLTEKYYGGDTSPVSDSGDVCTGTLPSPTYTVNHTYSNGALAATQYVGFAFKTVDNTINADTGLVSSSTESASLTTNFNYDALGRLNWIDRPAQARINYTYAEAAGTTPAQVTVSQVSTSRASGDTTTERTVQNAGVFDGFGRLVEEQRLMPAGTARRKTVYNASGWVTSVSEWEETPSHFTVFSNFDPFGRPRQTTAPDGTVSKIDYAESADYTGTKHGGVRTARRTVSVRTSALAPSDVTTTELYDGLGRLIKVVEPDPNPISETKYEYDAADRLRKVTMTDQATSNVQTRTFTYDGRGFLLSEVHPESGTTSYAGFDARGHVGKKLAGAADSPFDLRYKYDGAERLIKVTHPPTRDARDDDAILVKSFTFADANDGSTNYTMGKLTSAVRRNTMPSGAPGAVIDVTETYRYEDSAGRLTSKQTTVSGNSVPAQTYTQSYTYNDLGLLASTTYPGCGSQCLSPSFTVTPKFKNGLLKSIDNFTTSITYDLNGLVTEIDHPGGIADVVTVDPNHMPRPNRIQFTASGYDPCTSPTIDAQPLDQQISSGATATVSVIASSSASGPLTYQWFKDDSPDPMANESDPSCCHGTNVITASGRYRARIINSCGKIDSNTAYVRVCGSPVISSQPQSALIASGQSAPLLVSATGCSLSYQWYQGNSGDTSGGIKGTLSSYDTGPLSSSASYWVRVIDSTNTAVNSGTAFVTVCTAPTITVQPASSTYSGSAIPLSVSANSNCASSLSYQWYQGTAPSTTNPVGTGPVYLVQNLSVTTDYWVRVSSTGGSVDSTTATITFSPCDPPISIAEQPAANTTYTGSPIILTVQAQNGCPPYHYQWYNDPQPWLQHPVGGDSPSYSVPVPLDGTQPYWVKVTDSSYTGDPNVGITFTNQALVHCAVPAISLQPMSVTYAGPVTFTVTAADCGPNDGVHYHFQWFRGFSGNTSDPLTGQTNVPTFTTPTLTVTTRYWVQVSYDGGQSSVDSDTAVVTIPLPTPGPLTATFTPTQAQPNRISVSWGASSGQDHYELQRLMNGSWATIAQPTTALTYTDDGCPGSSTCVYRVRAVDQYGGSGSPYTTDLASTMGFTTIQSAVTRVAFSHFDQIRVAVNSIRAAHGDGPLTWGQILAHAGYANAVEPAQNGIVFGVHLLALRDAMNKARAAVGVPQAGYTDDLHSPTLIRSVHLTELQQRAQ